MRNYTYILLLILISQCSTKKVDNVSVMETKVDSNNPYEGYDNFTLALIDVTADIQIPGEKLTGFKPDVISNNVGVTSIKIGKNFNLEFIEQEIDLHSVIQDLENDIFYKSKIIKKTESELVYEKGLPDGSQSFIHFCKTINLDGNNIFVRSAKDSQFRQGHIDRMIKSTNSLKISNELVMNGQNN